MSLDRTALRLAAVMALTNGFRPPFPTRAMHRVYDSRIDPIQGLDRADMVPIIIVTAEDHQGESLSPTSGGPPFGHLVDLTFDLSIGLDTADGFVMAIETEPELEAALDHMEWQVKRALFSGAVNPWARWFHGESYSAALRVEGWRSSIYREREAGVRLSARQVIAQVRLRADDDDRLDDGGMAIPAPLGPLLAAVISDGGPYASTAAAVRDLIVGSPAGLTPAVLPMLERVRLREADHVATDEAHEGPAGNRAAGIAQADLT